MNRSIFAVALLAMAASSSAFASKSYTCGGDDSDLEVIVYSDSSISAGVTEWNNDYRLETREVASSKFKRVEGRNTDDGLSATEVSVSESLLEGEDTGYVVLIGGESSGKYPCKAE